MSTQITLPSLFHLSSEHEVAASVPELRACIEAEDVAMVRGLVPESAARSVMDRVHAGFSASDDTKVDHKCRVSDPRLIPNYQRLMLGEFGDSETQRSFFVRMMYSPLWNEDRWGMHASFRKLIALRNHLYGVESDFCLDGPHGTTYTLSRLHHYPSGGGFLNSHRDEVAAGVPAAAGLHGYIQVLLVLTEKGTDFHSGGGYFVRDGERVHYEDFTRPGDILIYNGRTLHGVSTVDPDAPTDLTSSAGRYSATVTLYRTR
ncbi:MAG TPA: hypothetical protein ENJ09_11035 [Planctomycetes bacterium]|nr:hypothetical protein [Planctomycetota bacterium]